MAVDIKGILQNAESAVKIISDARRTLAGIAKAANDTRESWSERDLTKLRLLMDGEKAENEATDKAIQEAIADFRAGG